MINGASINELIETRFYEVFPVRIIFYTLLGILGYGLLVFLVAGLSNIYNMIINGAYSSELGKKLLLNFLFGSIFGLLFWFVKNCLLAIPNYHPIPVKNQGLTIRYAPTPRLFKELGSERFPNEISTKNSQERIVRWIIFLVGLSCVGLVVFMLIKNEEYSLKIDFKTPVAQELFVGFSSLLFLYGTCNYFRSIPPVAMLIGLIHFGFLVSGMLLKPVELAVEVE